MATRSKLAVILHADIVGSTRLVQEDESAAHERFRDAFRRLSDAVAAYGGTTRELRGDALVAEFDRASDAVCAALSFQAANRAENEGSGHAIRPEVRVGIALGEVVVADGTVTGAGVVLAQRVEQLAPQGGVCLQGAVHDTVPRRLPIRYESLGERELKGFPEPVRVFSAAWEEGAEIPPPSGAGASPSVRPPVPDRPSIAVLPFQHRSGDPEQALFAEGMTEDLTTDLSKVSGIFVVSRASCLVYSDRRVDLATVGRELGVRYVLQGSVRRAGDRVRINAELGEAGSGRQVWADRYDGTVDDVFELQDAVGAEVVSALSVELTGGEEERLARVHTRNLDAYELFVRARSTPYPPLPPRIDNAREMFERVIELDPGFAGGYAGVAAMLALGATFDHADPAPRIDRALELSRKAIEVDETFGWSHSALGLSLAHRGEHDRAIAAARRAVELQPSDADGSAWLGWILGMSGEFAEGVERIDEALRLNPLFVNGPYLNLKGMTQVAAGDQAGAVSTFERNVGRQGPVGPPAIAFRAAALAALGRTEDAVRESAVLGERFPAFRLAGWNYLELYRDPGDGERVRELMAAAGVPG